MTTASAGSDAKPAVMASTRLSRRMRRIQGAQKKHGKKEKSSSARMEEKCPGARAGRAQKEPVLQGKLERFIRVQDILGKMH